VNAAHCALYTICRQKLHGFLARAVTLSANAEFDTALFDFLRPDGVSKRHLNSTKIAMEQLLKHMMQVRADPSQGPASQEYGTIRKLYLQKQQAYVKESAEAVRQSEAVAQGEAAMEPNGNSPAVRQSEAVAQAEAAKEPHGNSPVLQPPQPITPANTAGKPRHEGGSAHHGSATFEVTSGDSMVVATCSGVTCKDTNYNLKTSGDLKLTRRNVVFVSKADTPLAPGNNPVTVKIPLAEITKVRPSLFLVCLPTLYSY
jgi:hypothetical protein